MAKSELVQALDKVQAALATLLRGTGFRKSGRTYNRRVGDGLVHVVNLQMGQYVSGLYGKFAINLGVYLPCVPEIEYGRSAGKTIQEYSCEIRDRLGALAFSRRDVWWELDANVGKTAALICRLMDEYGLPFLDEYTDYDSVVRHFEAHGTLPFHNRGRSALAVAMVSHHLGRSEQARRYFDLADSEAAKHKGFRTHVAEVRGYCGL